MPPAQAVCSSFKQELLRGGHDFALTTGDVFMCALYTATATIGAGTTAYTSSNEHGATGTYTAGGKPLTNITPTLSGTTAITSFQNLTWSTSTIAAQGALIYNSTPTSGLSLTNPACITLDFLSVKSSTAGDFTIVFPSPPDSTNAIIRIV